MIILTTFERRRKIQSLLAGGAQMSVDELSSRFAVSQVTIRRDLRVLADQGAVVRGRGTAGAQNRYDLRRDMQLNGELKRGLAARAAELVSPGDVVLLGPGSTCAVLGQVLGAREDVVIVTNAVSFEPYLASAQARIIYLGGEYHAPNGSVTGAFAIDALNTLRIDKLFLGANGVTAAGITSDNFPDTLMVRTMIERAGQVILLADHSKFGRVCTIKIAETGAADIILSDSGLTPGQIAEIEALGTEMIII